MESDRNQFDESVGRLVYEDLVHLTFLAGRGLSIGELMRRFLKTLRPRIPARGLWLYDPSGLVARSAEDDDPDPPTPDLRWRGMLAEREADDRLVISIHQDVSLICRLAPEAAPGRAADVLALSARILALAWQAEAVAAAGDLKEDYRIALEDFRRRWLSALLERHQGNITACAEASGLSRMAIYDMRKRLGIRDRNPDACGP